MANGNLSSGSPGLERRDFIKVIAASGLVIGIGFSFGRHLLIGGSDKYVEVSRPKMGTYARILIFTSQFEKAHAAIESAFQHMSELEAIMTLFSDTSALSRLNLDGKLYDPPPALVDTLQWGQRVAALSGGAFDMTVEPLEKLFRQSFKKGVFPGAQSIYRTMDQVGFFELDVSGSRVSFQRPGMAVTLNGVAKGYIVDAGLEEIKRWGFDRVLLEAGGDLGFIAPAGAPAWRIGIQDPWGPMGETCGVASARNGAIATSGDYFDAYTSDRSFNHIIDPRHGYSPPELSSASVLAPTTCLADTLSTAVMVLGSKAGLAMIEGLSGVECLLVSKTGNMVRSSGFPSI